MSKSMYGVIRGRTIELQTDPGLADGQPVEVVVRVADTAAKEAWGDGLKRCAGALADSWTERDDRILAELHQERKSDSRLELED